METNRKLTKFKRIAEATATYEIQPSNSLLRLFMASSTTFAWA